MGSETLPDEDAELIKQAQRNAIMKDPTMAAATLVGAQADAMKTAAANKAGAMTGFMGMGMAINNGMNTQDLFAMGEKQKKEAPEKETWQCSCETIASGKFCPECGKPKPVSKSWTCSCGSVNEGNFCTNCGKKKPETASIYQCSNCGWKTEDASRFPRFCPDCGKPFNREK